MVQSTRNSSASSQGAKKNENKLKQEKPKPPEKCKCPKDKKKKGDPPLFPPKNEEKCVCLPPRIPEEPPAKPDVELVVADCLELGEAPHWDPESQCLYFVDVLGKSIHKFDPSNRKHTKAEIGVDYVSFIIPIEGLWNNFLISVGRQLCKVVWDGEAQQPSFLLTVAEVDTVPPMIFNKFSDGKCDFTGRLWAGTVGWLPAIGRAMPGMGTLYSLDKGKVVTPHLPFVGFSNGMAWNPYLKKFYYIDTCRETIDVYDFDQCSGKISNPEVIFNVRKHFEPGLLDGMTIDTDGNLWVAIFEGWRVIKIDPNVRDCILETIKLPAKQVTSVAFGGPCMDELYVTTGCYEINGVKIDDCCQGCVYRITGTGARGYPGYAVKSLKCTCGTLGGGKCGCSGFKQPPGFKAPPNQGRPPPVTLTKCTCKPPKKASGDCSCKPQPKTDFCVCKIPKKVDKKEEKAKRESNLPDYMQPKNCECDSNNKSVDSKNKSDTKINSTSKNKAKPKKKK